MAITKKQEKFAQEYIKDFNAVRAYERAFGECDYKSASAVTTRWLKDEELKEYINQLVDSYVKDNVNPSRIVLELQEIAFDRNKPLGERNKALAQLCKIYNLENMNLNVKADVNINPYENLTEEELKRLAGLDEDTDDKDE
jgi:phage terminase small subunit